MSTKNHERALQLTADLADCGERFVGAIDDLVPVVDELARLAAELRAVDGRLGLRRHGPDALMLASSVLLGRLSALRPHLPRESSAAADTAAELLCRDRQLELTGERPPANEGRPSW